MLSGYSYSGCYLLFGAREERGERFQDGRKEPEQWTGGDTEGFIIGQRCGIKLSYAHLRIFYYHRERRVGEHISPVLGYGQRRVFISSSFLILALVGAGELAS